MEIKYVKPLNDNNSVYKISSEMGFSLSDEFIEFFKVNNGGRPNPNEIANKSGAEKVVNSFLSFNDSDKDNVIKAKRRVSQDDESLFPFASDPAGNYFCLKNGKVVFYFCEDGEVLEVADSFESFLKGIR